MTPRKFLNHRHTFRFRTDDDSHQTIKAQAKVRPGRDFITLLLLAEHVRQAIDAHKRDPLQGVGNTMTCAMAFCAKGNRDIFPHAFMGYIDWQYSRCYVVSKLDKNRLPSECYVYLHDDEIAKLNDTAGGQQKLLADLIKNGPREIRLRPIRKRYYTPRLGTGGHDGSRTSKAQSLRGSHLRYAVAHLGGI